MAEQEDDEKEIYEGAWTRIGSSRQFNLRLNIFLFKFVDPQL